MALSHHPHRTEPVTRYSWTGFICPGVPGWASPEEPGAAAVFNSGLPVVSKLFIHISTGYFYKIFLYRFLDLSF